MGPEHRRGGTGKRGVGETGKPKKKGDFPCGEQGGKREESFCRGGTYQGEEVE